MKKILSRAFSFIVIATVIFLAQRYTIGILPIEAIESISIIQKNITIGIATLVYMVLFAEVWY
jgi:hypothetical protein